MEKQEEEEKEDRVECKMIETMTWKVIKDGPCWRVVVRTMIIILKWVIKHRISGILNRKQQIWERLNEKR